MAGAGATDCRKLNDSLLQFDNLAHGNPFIDAIESSLTKQARSDRYYCAFCGDIRRRAANAVTFMEYA